MCLILYYGSFYAEQAPKVVEFAENWSCGMAMLLFSSGLSIYGVKFTFPWNIYCFRGYVWALV